MLQVSHASLRASKSLGWQNFQTQTHSNPDVKSRCRATSYQSCVVHSTRTDTAVKASGPLLPSLPSIYALDVEFIHVRCDGRKEESLPAQVCLVDRYSRVIYKSYIRHPQLQPPPPGLHAFGGVKLHHVQQAPDLASVVRELRSAVCLPPQPAPSTNNTSQQTTDLATNHDSSTQRKTSPTAAQNSSTHSNRDPDQDTSSSSSSSMSVTFSLQASEHQRQPVSDTPGKLIGHGLWKDLASLGWEHPVSSCFDTTSYAPFQGKTGSAKTLQVLAWKHLTRRIQPAGRGHDPQEDACAVMDLYVKFMESNSQQTSYEDLVALFTHQMVERMREASADLLEKEGEEEGESEQPSNFATVDTVFGGLSSFDDNRL